MSQRGLLHIGGVVAAGAGFVSVPADFGAGGSLRVVAHAFMSQGGQLRIGRVVAAGTGLVGIPADGSAGGSLRVMLHQIVGVRVSAAVAALAHSTVGRSGAGRSGGFRVVCGFSIDRMPAASIGDLCRVLGLRGLYIRGRCLANVVVRVGAAVAALAHSTVGRSGAGRGGGWRVGLGRSRLQFSTAVVEHMWLVLGLGDSYVYGPGLANVGVGVRFDRAVGGVGAVLAGLIGFPAFRLAGRGLRGVTYGIVSLVILAAGLPAARACFRHRVLCRRACAWCIRVRVRALVLVRVIVGLSAVQARHCDDAGCIAAVVGKLDVFIIIDTNTVMLVFVLAYPFVPIVVVGVNAAVIGLANRAKCCVGAVRRVFFYVLCGDETARPLPAGIAGFDLLVEAFIFFFIRVRKGAFVFCRVFVGCLAFAARRRCYAVRVAVVRLGFVFAAAGVQAVAVMHIR